ncbi:MAG: TIGR03936 family radical SAM-associated protein [Synergistes sp.]|nr:TIGR03936 family radical SAM-associated protein [Synergistes sp.]
MARIRVLYEKKGLITFVNHMDLPVIFSRAARRAGISQEFTQGFSPHPRISLAPPLAIGVTGLAEPADFWLNELHDGLISDWNEKLPAGLKILKFKVIYDDRVLAKSVNAALYEIEGSGIILDANAEKFAADEAKKYNAFYSSSFENGKLKIAVGDLEHCGAATLVKALIAKDVIRGWSDVNMTRLAAGRWNTETSSVEPLV